MQFEGRHGYYDHELTRAQPFEVDVELVLNLQPAGIDDDLAKSVVMRLQSVEGVTRTLTCPVLQL